MADKRPNVELRKISELTPDEHNANRGTERGGAMIARSIQKLGAGRSLLLDKHLRIIAGNKTHENAGAIGLEDVILVHTRGDQVVAVVRDDLDLETDPQARELAYADNRTSQVDLDFDAEQIARDRLAGFDLSDWFDNAELDELVASIELDPADDEDGVPEPETDRADELAAKWQTAPGQLWEIGRHRLLCGDATNPEDVKRLLDGNQPALMVTDPPYGVEYDPSWRRDAGVTEGGRMGKVANDDRADWTEAWELSPSDVAYCWHAGVYASEVADSLTRADFQIRSQIIWAKDRLVLSRGHYHWQHEPCQPPGTMVRTPSGEVAIEALADGDRVVSYDSYSSVITGKRDGREVKVARRHYDGLLYGVSVDSSRTRATDGHQFTVRFSRPSSDRWCTYLMRKGSWWRTGVTRLYNSRGFGLAVRLSQEQGEEAWILAVHPTKSAAVVAEQVHSCRFGIPTTHWSTDRGLPGTTFRSEEEIRWIYDQMDAADLEAGARRLLCHYGRVREYPLVVAGEALGTYSRRKTIRVRACNLVPEIMEVPIPHEKGDSFDWRPIASVGTERYSGPVYSLDVAVDHHYIADGIVTHNCWYAVRNGSTAEWIGDRSQTTLWSIPIKDGDDQKSHGTQKPLGCMRRPIRNHAGDVYDPFCGSGTTMAAAEKETRRCFALELDPRYVAVILERMSAMGLEPLLVSGEDCASRVDAIES